MSNAIDLKQAAAARAAELVEDGMNVGLGSGSTAYKFVSLLAERVRNGLKIVGVPTSEITRQLAIKEGITVSTLDETPSLDMTVDGADEMTRSLHLIKGGGGCLLWEKIVAVASSRNVVIADGSKLVETLGRFPLPIEVNKFGLEATRRAIINTFTKCGLNGEITVRQTEDGQVFVTDGGHLILDAALNSIPDPEKLSVQLNLVPGVVENGLFVGISTDAIIATETGLVEWSRV
ncbi:ribose-5-phosphate isomerase RpiA [Microvirga sp. W0021]|uniref:Ribose-5-phosphate isomerase A n=1 Tax=Hohaiivirga grylli TaxID=3133970 RepID=A0ABV0BHL0_9HYPH